MCKDSEEDGRDLFEGSILAFSWID